MFPVAMFLIAVLATAGAAVAQEEGTLPPGMTPEIMKMWQDAATPGPEHASLAEMAGSWTFTGTFVMAPGAPPQTATGTAERKLILGGRVLLETVHSEMFGQPFEGMGLTGYDNVAGQYWGTWNDNLGTGIMLSTGSCSEDGACEFMGTWNDAMVGGPKSARMTLTSDGDTETHAMYDTTPDGAEFKSMELVYTRAGE
jgi:hypothetical protein